MSSSDYAEREAQAAADLRRITAEKDAQEQERRPLDTRTLGG